MNPKHYKRMPSKFWTTVEEKMCELGPASLTNAEVLSLIIAPHGWNKAAEEIGVELLSEFKGYEGLADQSFEKMLSIKGMGDRKVYRLAAAMEFAKRWVAKAINMLQNDRELRIEVFGH